MVVKTIIRTQIRTKPKPPNQAKPPNEPTNAFVSMTLEVLIAVCLLSMVPLIYPSLFVNFNLTNFYLLKTTVKNRLVSPLVKLWGNILGRYSGFFDMLRSVSCLSDETQLLAYQFKANRCLEIRLLSSLFFALDCMLEEQNETALL